MRRLALIPARGGSKRLPRKNIKPFAARPMIEWTLDAARASNLFTDIVVSTDDEETVGIAKSAKVDVLERGDDISNDAATLFQVIKHALVSGYGADEICLLLANCPLRTAEDIEAGYTAFKATDAPATLSVTSFSWTPPFRALTREPDGRILHVFGDWIGKKSQEYPEVVCPSGAVYWVKLKALEGASDLYVDGITGFDMPWHRAIDIDTAEDFALAACIKHSIDNGFTFEA
ncbi:MAG: acylneuraminate cytidylyltransferase family protein [Proteobacteria bacterium]|nr:acylneuraminate cytidylyltransferase family protein [Pseudomonadota bacterium]